MKEASASGADSVIVKAPDSVTAQQTLLLPGAANAANQTLRFGAPSGSISTGSWATPLWAGGTNANGYFDWTLGAAPGNPASGDIRLYPKTGSTLCARDSAGTETCYGAGGGATQPYTGPYSALAGQPCSVGELFLLENSLYNFARCTATNTWGALYADGKKLSPITAEGSWSWAGTTSSIDETYGYTTINSTGTLNQVSVRVIPAPAGTWKRSYLVRSELHIGDAAGGIYVGIRNSVTGATESIVLQYVTGVGCNVGTVFAVRRESPIGTFVSNDYIGCTTQSIESTLGGNIYFQVEKDATNFSWRYSVDGNTWNTAYTVALGSSYVADDANLQLMIGVRSTATGSPRLARGHFLGYY